MDKVADIALAIIGVAMVTTIVAHKNSARVITAVGNSFSSSIRAATGR